MAFIPRGTGVLHATGKQVESGHGAGGRRVGGICRRAIYIAGKTVGDAIGIEVPEVVVEGAVLLHHDHDVIYSGVQGRIIGWWRLAYPHQTLTPVERGNGEER